MASSMSLEELFANNPDLALANEGNDGIGFAGVRVASQKRGGATHEHVEAMVNMLEWIGAPAPTREYVFHQVRKWRFDIAWPDLMIAVEIDGGVWTQGRHTRGAGYIADCEKFAEAAVLGWVVVRFPTDWVDDGTAITYVERLLKAKGAM